MTLHEALDIPCGLRFIVDSMAISSPVSRSALLSRRLSVSAASLECEYDAIGEFPVLIADDVNTAELLRHKLSKIKNIVPAVERLEYGGVSDEIDLFEIKSQAMLAREIGEILNGAAVSLSPVPDTGRIIDILDPDSLGVASFYIYDSYSERLGELRRQAKRTADPIEREKFTQMSLEEEASVRKTVSDSLRPLTEIMRRVQRALVDIDIRLATASLMAANGFARPEFAKGETSVYAGLFHPEIKAVLNRQCKEFQPVDISFGGTLPTTIIGANMGGKTVTLKMLAAAQLSAQFALGVPAREAAISIKENVILCSGDNSSGTDGLSSFGNEVRRIGEIIAAARSGERLLALVDEPARTTNPIEGAALAAALVNVMRGRAADLVLTTHYNLISSESRRLRVAGYRDGRMDYSLVPTEESEIPHEALTIAAALGADGEWLDEAERMLGKNRQTRK